MEPTFYFFLWLQSKYGSLYMIILIGFGGLTFFPENFRVSQKKILFADYRGVESKMNHDRTYTNVPSTYFPYNIVIKYVYIWQNSKLKVHLSFKLYVPLTTLGCSRQPLFRERKTFQQGPLPQFVRQVSRYVASLVVA